MSNQINIVKAVKRLFLAKERNEKSFFGAITTLTAFREL